MGTTKWPIAIPLAILLMGAPAWGSAIRDEAKMFSPRVVEEAQRRLERLERTTNVPVIIETIEHVPGIARGMPSKEKLEAINQHAKRRDSQIHDEGIYILVSKSDQVISEPLIRARLEDILPLSRRDAITQAFLGAFKKHDFDGGLERGVEAIEKALEGHRVGNARVNGRAGVPAPIGAGAHRVRAGGGSSVFGTFILIGLGILAVLILLRVLGGLFGRGVGGGYPNQMGPMGGPRPGMGPGYNGGGPGYGGRGGGGFFSGLLGGLGGAMAGNWLYDQMTGRHGGMTSAGAGYPVDDSTGSIPDRGDDAIIGADDHGGQGGGSWDAGGTDTGGGDWGGGDAGGDWGGGGGDWGGGGGDWGGGDGGGGDW